MKGKAAFRIAPIAEASITQRDYRNIKQLWRDDSDIDITSAFQKYAAEVSLEKRDMGKLPTDIRKVIGYRDFYWHGDAFYLHTSLEASRFYEVVTNSPCMHCGKNHSEHAGDQCIFHPTKYESAAFNAALQVQRLLETPPTAEEVYKYFLDKQRDTRNRTTPMRVGEFNARTLWRTAELKARRGVVSLVGQTNAYPMANFAETNKSHFSKEALEVRLTPDVIAFARRVVQLVDALPGTLAEAAPTLPSIEGPLRDHRDRLPPAGRVKLTITKTPLKVRRLRRRSL